MPQLSYNVCLALHVISIVSWMAGLLYLPRLFVYHTQIKTDSDSYKLFITMERRLLFYIMTPAMISSAIFGHLLTSMNYEYLSNSLWFYLKILAVAFLVLIHLFSFKFARNFANNCNKKSKRFFKIFNEIPTILMIIIIFLVELKPFTS